MRRLSMVAAAACCARVSSDRPPQSTQLRPTSIREQRSCYCNAAFGVNKGHYGKVRLDGLKFWFAGDKGDAKTVELTFEPSATKEQREGIREFLTHFLPLKWESFTEGPDAKI